MRKVRWKISQQPLQMNGMHITSTESLVAFCLCALWALFQVPCIYEKSVANSMNSVVARCVSTIKVLFADKNIDQVFLDAFQTLLNILITRCVLETE